MKNLRNVFAALMATILLSGCGGGDYGPSGPNDGGSCSGTFFCATIDGQAWTSDQLYLTQSSAGAANPGSLNLTGQQTVSVTNYRTVLLGLGRIAGPGTYPLGTDGISVAGGSGSVVIAAGGTPNSWHTPIGAGNTGSITITSLTGGRIVGTFNFTAAPLLGSGANVTVTGGSFNLPLPSNFVAATGVDLASQMSGTVGGAAWNAGSVIVLGDAGSQQISGSNSAYQVLIIPITLQSQGTFQLGVGVTLRVTQSGGTNSWGAVGSTGSVTYTTLSSTRAIGTFSGTLTPIGATVGNITVSGSFDVKLP